MVVFHKIEACGRCRGATMWRLTNGKLQCGRCHRRKRVSRRRPSSVDVAAVTCGLLVIVATWVAFAFGGFDSWKAFNDRWRSAWRGS